MTHTTNSVKHNYSAFKILSIDGGGIKGIYVAQLLSQIEKKIGRPIGEYFDMIAGTSTGGLIALAITNKVPCEKISKFYEDFGPLIFPHGNFVTKKIQWFKQVFSSVKYGNAELIKALTNIIPEGKNMNSANHILCIPAFNITKGRPTVFKKPFGTYHRDGRFSMIDIGLATSAAPTYFPSVLIENDQYVDGGIFANNPSMIAYTEAVDHFLNKAHTIDGQHINYNGIHLLSIGLPSDSIGMPTKTKSRRSFLGWKDMLIKSAMTGTEYITKYQVDKLLNSTPNSRYFRINPEDLSTEQLKHVRMDNSSKTSISTLLSYGQEAGDIYTSTKWSNIESFFNNPKTYKF